MAAFGVSRSGGEPKQGWYRDPTGRHAARRWDGDGWSEWVIDGGRRSFDDIDGCGGPPPGEPVAVDDQPVRKRLGARTIRSRRSVGGGGASGSADALLPSPDAAANAVPWAIGIALVGGSAALAIAVLGERSLLQFAAAAVVFEAIVLAGATLLYRRTQSKGSAWPALRRMGTDGVLRGVIVFLLALFARTFVLSLVAGPFGLGLRPVGPWWVFAIEAVTLLVVAPVVEERVFRGVLLAGLRRRSGPVVAVLGQAAIYGAALSWTSGSRPAAALGMMAVGAVFGWFVHVTDDLRPVIVGHVFLNSWFLLERVLAG